MIIVIFLFLLQSANSLNCNGYSQYCSKPLNTLLFPGTHNSFAIAPVSSLGQTPPVAANQNAGWTISQQLSDGIRAMTWEIYRFTDGTLHLCHGGCSGIFLDGGSLKSSISAVQSFVSTNPNDLLFISIGNFASTDATELSTYFNSLIPNIAILTLGQTIPTLGSLLSTSKNLLLFLDSGLDTSYPWLLSYSDWITITNYENFSPSDLNNCNIYQPSPPRKTFTVLNHMLYIGVPAVYYPNYAQVSVTNSLSSINAQIATCTSQNVIPNVVLVDFGQGSDVFKAVAQYNGVTYTKTSGDLTLFTTTSSIMIAIFCLL